MRLGLIRDIHGSVAALDIAIEKVGGQVTEVLCAGNAAFQFGASNDVIRTLRSTGARVVLGDHDGAVLGPLGERVPSHPDTGAVRLHRQPARAR